MPLKIHLIIISVIIAIALAIQLSSSKPAPAPQAQQNIQKISDYDISVARASWGLNCRVPINNNSNSNNSYPDSSDDAASGSAIRENNVLTAVSNICNGKAKCDITVDAKTLGLDPLPTCMNKQLVVEYRCFSYDRAWTAKATNGALNIDCEKQLGSPSK